MKNERNAIFTVNKENYTVNVRRIFTATNSEVWAAWTEKELLDQWWAPLPWKSMTKSMDFSEGGYRLYAMVGPEGEEHWARADYTSISPKSNFKFLDAFCDSVGNINKDLPGSNWNVDFKQTGDETTVLISIKHGNLADLEAILSMGFKEGFEMALGNLEAMLS